MRAGSSWYWRSIARAVSTGDAVWAAAGAPPIAEFVREKSPNNFPRLPVRESEAVFVWFVKFRDRAAYGRLRAPLDAIGRGQATLLVKPSDVLVLEPTARSQLHG